MLGGVTGNKVDGNTVIRGRRVDGARAVRTSSKITKRVEIRQC